MTAPSSSTTPQSSDFGRFASALAGQYELECEIGRGGMGIVYLARDLRLDRRVAIKTLPAHLAGDSVVRERFLREARTAGALSHQHIVPIHRADELGGFVFFVMGYVDGESMAQRIRDRGRLDPRETLRELADVASALAYAHRRGVIHRDVKAENILIDGASGAALVTDFGIARLAESAPLTATGQVLGTVYYLSPEQVSGEAIDARSDIYSLGVVGYFALTGRFPFDAELASAVLVAHVTKTPAPVLSLAPGTPRVLADVIDRCLAKNPAERFQNCEEIFDRLNEIRAEVDAAPRPSIERQPLVSDTEAHAILGRAADLQALTGIQSTPMIPGMRDAQRDAARTSGHRPLDLRDAAVEAGIPAKYVDRAMVEHGLSDSPVTALAGQPSGPPGVVVNHSDSGNWFIGSGTRLDFEVVIEGEMPESDFDLLLEIIRQHTGEAGIITTVGRSFSWASSQNKGTTNVSVLSRAGKTRIRISESLRSAAGGIFAGMMGGAGGGSIGPIIGASVSLGTPAAGAITWVCGIGLLFIGARNLFRMHNKSRSRRLVALGERLAAQARESIDFAMPKLQAPSGRQLR